MEDELAFGAGDAGSVAGVDGVGVGAGFRGGM